MSDMEINLADLDDVDVNTGVRQTPDDGDYDLVIVEASMKNNKKGNGNGLAMKYTILDGPFQGNDIYGWINVSHPNENAARIGRGDLKTLLTVTDSASSKELVGKSLRARLVGELSDYTSKQGNKTKVVNLRPVIFMTLDGKNAKGEDVPAFVPSANPAKKQLDDWKANNGSGGNGVNHQSSSIPDYDDSEIPF